MTTVLRISHRVANYDRWKVAFDSDPVGRSAAGVVCHQVLRDVDDPTRVSIDLEFDTRAEANAMLDALRPIWQGVTGTLISDLRTEVAEITERDAYTGQ